MSERSFDNNSFVKIGNSFNVNWNPYKMCSPIDRFSARLLNRKLSAKKSRCLSNAYALFTPRNGKVTESFPADTVGRKIPILKVLRIETLNRKRDRTGAVRWKKWFFTLGENHQSSGIFKIFQTFHRRKRGYFENMPVVHSRLGNVSSACLHQLSDGKFVYMSFKTALCRCWKAFNRFHQPVFCFLYFHL